eukprot:symbB.v1.2.032738.t1/scaffold3964.1/size47361/2
MEPSAGRQPQVFCQESPLCWRRSSGSGLAILESLASNFVEVVSFARGAAPLEVFGGGVAPGAAGGGMEVLPPPLLPFEGGASNLANSRARRQA